MFHERNRTLSAATLVLLLASGAGPASSPSAPATVGPTHPARQEASPTPSRESVERETILSLVSEHRAAADEAWRRRLADAIHRESTAVGVDPLLVAAIVARESSFRTRVESRAGAVGLMQLRPFVARDVAQRSDVEWRGRETLHSPEANVRLGAAYFRELVESFDGDTRLALVAYHRGPTRLRRQIEDGSFKGSRYALEVLRVYETLDSRRAGRSDSTG